MIGGVEYIHYRSYSTDNMQRCILPRSISLNRSIRNISWSIRRYIVGIVLKVVRDVWQHMFTRLVQIIADISCAGRNMVHDLGDLDRSRI